jgi:hypothetical protein
MYFKVTLTSRADLGDQLPGVLLVEDQWDDWFQFSTMYTV